MPRQRAAPDAVSLGIGSVAALNEVAAMKARRIAPAKEGGDSAWRCVTDPVGIVGRQLFVDELAERLEAADVPRSAAILESDRRGLIGIILAFTCQDRLDAGNQVGHLAALVAGLGEHEA